MTRPTYGSELDHATQQLTAVLDSIPAAEGDLINDAVAFTAALRQLYRVLYRQVVLITGHQHSPLAVNLALATTRTAEQLQDISADQRDTTTTGLGNNLTRAVDHARTATDILATHLGPDGAPRTPEGIALLAGLDRDTHLAGVARLVALTARLDNQAQRHLRHHDPDASNNPATRTLLEAARTQPGQPKDLTDLADDLADQQSLPATYLTGVTAAIDVSGTSWPAVNDHAGFVDALDAARAWLAQHHRHGLAGQHLRLMLGAGLALTNELAYFAHRAGNTVLVDEQVDYVVRQWRFAYLSTQNVTTLGHLDDAAGPAALGAAESWLRSQLRHQGAWRDDLPTADDPATSQQWNQTATALAARLPDIAAMLHTGAATSTARNNLCALAADTPANKVIHNPRWVPGTFSTPAIARLLVTTAELRESSELLSRIVGGTPLTGSFDAYHGRGKPLPTIAAIAAIVDPALPAPRNSATVTSQSDPFSNADGISPQPAPSHIATPRELVQTLDERVRRAERQGWGTAKLPISTVRDLRDTIGGLLTAIDDLRREIISRPPPSPHEAPRDDASTDSADAFRSPELYQEIVDPDVS